MPTIKKHIHNGTEYQVPQQVTPGNGTVTICQGGTRIGSFSVNQSGNTTINLQGGVQGDADFLACVCGKTCHQSSISGSNGDSGCWGCYTMTGYGFVNGYADGTSCRDACLYINGIQFLHSGYDDASCKTISNFRLKPGDKVCVYANYSWKSSSYYAYAGATICDYYN